MLLKGRAKFFITDADEMSQLQQELDVDVLKFSTKQLYAKNLYMGFAKTDKGKKLVAEFNKRLLELINDGTMQQLYNKWGLTQNTAGTISMN
jgi:ABC-type amino acid transport substrate-binding protein